DLNEMRALPVLRGLKVWYSSVRDLSALANCPELESIELDNCLIEDLSPLLQLPKLWKLTCIGQPLSDESFHEVRPKVIEHLQKNRATELSRDPFDTESDWKLGRELFDLGLRVTVSRYQGNLRLACPGLKYYDH